MWVWALRGSRHFEPTAYSVWPQRPHRGELIIVSLVHDCRKAHNALVRDLKLADERYKANPADPVYLEQMELVNHLLLLDPKICRALRLHEVGEPPGLLSRVVHLSPPGAQG